jgi:hypothetical protein
MSELKRRRRGGSEGGGVDEELKLKWRGKEREGEGRRGRVPE